MEIVEAKSILPFIYNAEIIGVGTTSICFRMRDNMVFKLYKSPIELPSSFHTKMDRISTISNDTYIGPKKVLMVDNQIRGYFTPYIDALRFRNIDDNTKISKLFETYEKLSQDTKDVSFNNFRLSDIHNKNILFNGNYYIIDLDGCYFVDVNHYNNYILNMSIIFNTIIKQIFKTEIWQLPIFEDKDIAKYLEHINSTNIDEIYDLIRTLSNYCNSTNPTIKEVRSKIKVKNVFNEYYKF